jgi:hypothetical protein
MVSRWYSKNMCFNTGHAGGKLLPLPLGPKYGFPGKGDMTKSVQVRATMPHLHGGVPTCRTAGRTRATTVNTTFLP